MQLPDISQESLLKLFHTDVYGFPLFSLLMLVGGSAIVGGWYWRRGTTVEKRIMPSNKASHIPTAEEFGKGEDGYTLGIGNPSIKEYEPPRMDGGSDLEDRLISAVAHAPWKVKEGSEIDFEESEPHKWRIATKKITFVLEGNQQHTETQPAQEPTPPSPETQEETE